MNGNGDWLVIFFMFAAAMIPLYSRGILARSATRPHHHHQATMTPETHNCNLPQCLDECPRLGCYIGRRWVLGFAAKKPAPRITRHPLRGTLKQATLKDEITSQ